jgi:hypothetical protein
MADLRMTDAIISRLEAESAEIEAELERLYAEIDQIPPQERTGELWDQLAVRHRELMKRFGAITQKAVMAFDALDEAGPRKKRS